MIIVKDGGTNIVEMILANLSVLFILSFPRKWESIYFNEVRFLLVSETKSTDIRRNDNY